MNICTDHRRVDLPITQSSKHRRKAVANAAALALLETLESRQLLTVSLDTSFGGDGMIDTVASSAVSVLPDNKILLGKLGPSNGFTLYRYNTNGTLDNSYGSGGSVEVNAPFTPEAILISGGKIYVADAQPGNDPDTGIFTIARYTQGAVLDGSFGGGDGIASATFVGNNPGISKILAASDGDVIVAGKTEVPNGADLYASLARFNSDGSLDTTFGGTGTVQRYVYAKSLDVNGYTLSPAGDIYAAVTYFDNLGQYSSVYRFHRDGSSDDFPGTLPAVFQSGDRKIAVQPGNKLIRYKADDSVDSTFIGNGLALSSDYVPAAVTTLPDDSILISGSRWVPNGNGSREAFIAKTQPNGEADTFFAPGGIFRFSAGYTTSLGQMQLTPDGKILANSRVQQSSAVAGVDGLARFVMTAPPPQTPFNGSPFNVDSTIQAEDFDRGGEGVAYRDTDTTNNGGAYRPTEGVDIEATRDTGGGYDVGWTMPGEWMEYTINVPTAGAYTIQTRIASPKTGGSIHYEIDGQNVSGNVSVPNTGGFQTFTTITSNLGTLSAGNHVLRLAINPSPNGAGVANINWMKIVSATGGGGGGGGGGGTGTGLTGQYFNNMDFTAPVFSRPDAKIDFNWGTGSPDSRIQPDTFSVRWTGQVSAPTTGRYTFYTTTDDGVRLTVNGQKIIDHLTPQASTEWSGSVDLVAGQKVPIVMEYFERYGGALAKLQWSGPGIAKQVVPQSNLFTTAATQVPAAPFLSKVFSRNVGNNQTQMVLNITPPSGADQLIVERFTSGDAAYAPIATIAGNSTSYTDTNNLLKNRVYAYRVRAVNAAGSSPYSNENANQTPSFNSADIGSPTPAGFTTVGERAGFASLYAGGRDIEGLSDQFHYSYVSYSGDFEWIAKLGAAPSRTNEWAKAGLMIRASLAANAPYIAIFYTPDHGYRVQYRTVAGGGTTTYSGGTSGSSAPEMQIVRTGDSFDLIVRDNGTFRRINTQIVDLPDTALVGMAATSHDPTQRTLVDFAQFSRAGAA